MGPQSIAEVSAGAPEVGVSGKEAVPWVEAESLAVVPRGVDPNLSSKVEDRVVKRVSKASTLAARVDTFSRTCWSRAFMSAEVWARPGAWAESMLDGGVTGGALDATGEREWDCNGGKMSEAGLTVSQALWSGGGAG